MEALAYLAVNARGTSIETRSYRVLLTYTYIMYISVGKRSRWKNKEKTISSRIKKKENNVNGRQNVRVWAN